MTFDKRLDLPATGATAVAGPSSQTNIGNGAKFNSGNHIENHVFRNLQTVTENGTRTATTGVRLNTHGMKTPIEIASQ